MARLETASSVEQQKGALSALRELLVVEGSEVVPPAAAEAAEAEGVPARLRAVALSVGGVLERAC